MKLWIKRAGTALLGLVVVWLGLMWSHWLPRPSAEQASALAQMRAPMAQAKGERNAFGLFWQLDYDIPEAERAQVLAEDVAALDGWRPGQDLEALASRARGRYPSRVAKDAPPLPPCEADCLAQVRADPEPWRAALAARQSRLAELGQLAHYDHLRTPFKMSLYSPIPAFQGTGDLQIAAAALAFADGQTEAALSGLCRDLGQWRRLKGRSDLLLSEMISLAWLRNGGRLYADMRAELAADQPLPAACVTLGLRRVSGRIRAAG